MTTSMLCQSCAGDTLPGVKPGEVLEIKPEHCKGRSDRPAPKGVLGGFACSCPCRYKPHELHAMAQRQDPDNQEAAARYIELMKEAGHIVPRHPDDKTPMLPCGWEPS